MNRQRAYGLEKKLRSAIATVKDPRTVFELHGVFYDAATGKEMPGDEVKERPLIHLSDAEELRI